MRKKQPAPPLPSDEVAELRQSVDQLAQEVRVLRQVLDELREELTWGIRNDKLSSSTKIPPMVLTSMPLDPLAAPGSINRFTAADLRAEPQQSAAKSRQSLFE